MKIAPFLIAALVSAFSWSALAAPQCNTRAIVLEQLKQNYNETPAAVGLGNNGGLVEVLTTKNGESWSIIVTSPKGISCLVSAGEGWRRIPQPPAGDPL